MRLSLIAVGRLKKGPEDELVGRYGDRLRRAGPAVGLEFAGASDFPESRAAGADARRAEESARILSSLPERAALVILDERGRDIDSAGLAAFVARERDAGRRDLVVAIGGPDGHDETLRRRADLVLAFGRMTMPHMLVRVLAAEQLYRVVTLLSGHPYHRE